MKNMTKTVLRKDFTWEMDAIGKVKIDQRCDLGGRVGKRVVCCCIII